MIDPAVIAGAAAVKMQVPVADLEESSTAALEYIAADLSTTVDLIPDTAAVRTGAVLLTQRIYLDVPARSGDLDAFGSFTLTGLSIPVDLGTHLRHYWQHEQHRWGIA